MINRARRADPAPIPCPACGNMRKGYLAFEWSSCPYPAHYACNACAARARRARNRIKRVICKSCEGWFETTRVDASYCSPACRQKAYGDRCAA